MQTISNIEQIQLSNGKSVRSIHASVREAIENIYRECWSKGVSIPFWDDFGNTYLANPDGSEDLVSLDRATRTYTIIRRTTQPRQGKNTFVNMPA